MKTEIIDGKAYAEKLRADIAARVAQLKERGMVPGLAVILVGDPHDPKMAASQVYVRNKVKYAQETGMNSLDYIMSGSTTQEQLLAKINELNRNPGVHGILVQLPLPKHISEEAVIAAIDPDKDVDGFHALNVGKLASGQAGLVPCTPMGCLMLLKNTVGDLTGKHAVVIGRSNIVGKPMARMLLNESCTVTVAHSKTQDLPKLLKQADIVVAAVGKPQMVKGEWLKKGAVVIDVGINRIDLGRSKSKLVGDVDFESCQGIVKAITPVPGGVGPMTIACLLENTYRAATASLEVRASRSPSPQAGRPRR